MEVFKVSATMPFHVGTSGHFNSGNEIHNITLQLVVVAYDNCHS